VGCPFPSLQCLLIKHASFRFQPSNSIFSKGSRVLRLELARWTPVLTASDAWLEECIPAIGIRPLKRRLWEASSKGVAGRLSIEEDDVFIRDVGKSGRVVLLFGWAKRREGGMVE
jgi:hypothetical protein